MSAPDAANTKPQAEGASEAAAGEPIYKEVLDKVAHEARNPPKPDTGTQDRVHPLVEKGTFRERVCRVLTKTGADTAVPVAQYVPPSVGKALGIKKDESPPKDSTPAEGPPDRPDHDPQIEEFVRDQHRSRPGDITAAMES